MTPTQYRNLRKRLGTQAEVACMLEVTREHLNGRERGRFPIRKEAALALRRLAEEKVGVGPVYRKGEG